MGPRSETDLFSPTSCCYNPHMRILFLALCVIVLPAAAAADPVDLSGGVVICHAPPSPQFSTDPPPDDWCEHYDQGYAFDCCEGQNPRIDTAAGEGSIWFLIAAWDEDKQLCGFDLGFADYPAEIYGFVEWGPCCTFGVDCLEISSAGWPGPIEGTAVAFGMEPWYGNFLTLYWFAGYVYGSGVIPLGCDPATDDAAFGNCEMPPEGFDIECLGAMGILTDGVFCCPAGGPSPAVHTTWGTLRHLYR